MTNFTYIADWTQGAVVNPLIQRTIVRLSCNKKNVHQPNPPPILILMILQPLVGLSLLLAPAPSPTFVADAPRKLPAAGTVAEITGLYVATRLNYYPLPRIERVPTTDGWEHWFKLLEALITVRPDGRFIASFKYYRQHVRPRAAVNPGPLLNETYKGKYTVRGNQITFVPDKTKEHKVVKPLVGTISGTQLSVPYIVAEGQSKHPLRLDMKREGSW